jgi:hypothetical protein
MTLASYHNLVEGATCEKLMDRTELLRVLESEGVRADAVDLTGDTLREAYCLERSSDGSGWVTYYRERGIHRAERRFDAEGTACEHLLAEVLRDPTTRQRSGAT